MKRFLISLVCMALGFAIIKYREALYRFTGPNAWAERWLGSGGTFNLYILIGSGVVIASILYLFGVLDGLTEAVFGRLF